MSAEDTVSGKIMLYMDATLEFGKLIQAVHTARAQGDEAEVMRLKPVIEAQRAKMLAARDAAYDSAGIAAPDFAAF